MAQIEVWNAGASDVTLYTPDGAARSVIFLPGTLKKSEIFKEHGRRAEFLVSFDVAEVG